MQRREMGERMKVKEHKGSDSIKLYFSEIRKIPLLSAKEERRIVWHAKRKNGAWARKTLIESNLRLVVTFAKRDFVPNSFFTLNDLISAGNIGLIKAVKKYKLSFKKRFSTYAGYWIRQAIGREIANNKTTVRTPVGRVLDIAKYRKAKRMLQVRGEDVTRDGIASEMKISLAQVIGIEFAKIKILSVDDDQDDEKNPHAMQRYIASPIEDIPHRLVVRNRGRAQCLRMIEEANLEPREKEVIFKRFGFCQPESRAHTLEEIGKEFRMSKNNVHLIQERALAKLRKRYMPAFEDMRAAEAMPY